MTHVREHYLDVLAAQQYEDGSMQEANDVAALEQAAMDHLVSIDPDVDMEEHAKQCHEGIILAQLDDERETDDDDTTELIAEYEQSEAGIAHAQYMASIIPGQPDTSELTIEWPGQGRLTTFRRLPYRRALASFNRGKAPVFDTDTHPVSQDIWPGLRYNKDGVLASTLRSRKKYFLEGKPESFLNMLPGELRELLYAYVFSNCFNVRFEGKRYRQQLRTLIEPSLSQAIQSLRPEILSFYFARADFAVTTYSKMLATGSVVSHARTYERGGRWATGRLALGMDHWLRKVQPSTAIRFHSVTMSLQERDGCRLVDLIFTFCKNHARRGRRLPTMIIKKHHPRLADQCLTEGKRVARDFVKRCKKIKGFPGYSLDDMENIAAVFKKPKAEDTPLNTAVRRFAATVEAVQGILDGTAA